MIKHKKQVGIVIPLYKDFHNLSEEEILSLKSCCKHLNNYPHVVFGPEKIHWKKYQQFYFSLGIVIEIKIFESRYFNSINGYNLLLRSIDFYREFRKYKFILIFQPDAFIFKDELSYWCDKGYDYIGAPWNGTDLYFNKPIIGVGNGGFSLRNVNSAIKLLRKLRVVEILKEYNHFNWKGIAPRIFGIFKRIILTDTASQFENTYTFQEDVFWCVAVQDRLNSFESKSLIINLMVKCFLKNNFKIAPESIASKFSFETRPAELYKLNNKKLPFGCHAWEKYDPEFWKPFISFDL